MKSNFSEEFKRDAVRQITERGYPVAEVSQRLGVSQHSLYEWKKKFAASNAKGNSGQGLGHGHHLHPDLRRLCLLGRRHRPLFPPGHRLGNAEPPNHRRRVAGSAHGCVEAQAEEQG